MMLIITQLTENVNSNKHAAGNANGQPKDINENISLLPANVSESSLDIIFNHGRSFS
jgi:hypothetical protein